MPSLLGQVERVGAHDVTHAEVISGCVDATGSFAALCETFLPDIERYESLIAHMAELEATHGILRPLKLLYTRIPDVTDSVLKQHEFTMPMTLDGLIYLIAGGFIGLASFALLWGTALSLFRLFDHRA
jgi:hypothetical protein